MSQEAPILPETIGVEDVEMLYALYNQPLLAFLKRFLGAERYQAEDLLQDTFFKVQKSLEGRSIPAHAIRPWLYRIAKNMALDVLRRQQRIAWTPLSTLEEVSKGKDLSAHPREDVLYQTLWHNGAAGGRFEDQVIEWDLVRSLFQSLAPKYAACLWLYGSGYSYAEIAQHLHISLDAVKIRLKRAREHCTVLISQE